MKTSVISCLFLLAFAASAFASAPLPSSKGNKTLPAGTLVILETTEKIASDQVTVGKTLLFRVRMNVVVDGKTVIATGALAVGRVKSIARATYNNPEEITLEVLYAQAVDGQQVALNGAEQTYRGTFPNESTAVEPGQTITATVMNNIQINL
ncbi:MAG: hypothetical protein DYG98_15995 [Haliscomenobacteraceae bacterium CHB4]|nr:hypothetical protein [Saprospiraceae bacterium]MCE7924549.1 hypothetical protein [Haliscomenobacteraceae bacterium CHB4]